MLVALLAFGSAAIRLQSLPYENNDTILFFVPWYERIRDGGLAALAEPFYSYPPPYLCLQWMIAKLNLFSPLTSIKVLSILFDLAGAAAAWLMVGRVFPGNRLRAAWAAVVVLCAPVVWIDGAYWGQSDMIYTTFMLFSVYLILSDRPYWAAFAAGLAFAFKAPAAFIAPLFLLLLFEKRIPWRCVFIPPAVFILAQVPALAAGRPLGELLTVYFRQASVYPYLSMNAPNPYFFIAHWHHPLLVAAGIVLAVVALLALGVFFYQRRITSSPAGLLLACSLFLIAAPFLLPKMHERFFFPAAVFMIMLAFFRRDLLLAALLAQVSSLLSYLRFLRGFPPMVVTAGVWINLALLCILLIAAARFVPERG